MAADHQLLRPLVTSDARYDPSAGCLDGTRTKIRSDIHEWIDNCNSSQSLFWLYGPAGCGKSTVARSVCEKLTEIGCLGGTFFCERDNEQLRKPENIASTLAANLAFVCQPYGAELVTVLRQSPQLINSALVTQFRHMFTEPIKAIGSKIQQKTLVFVVDALDECGTDGTRIRLLECLLDLCRLTTWLKVIVTSRPSVELANFFRKEGDIPRHDLFQEDYVSISADISSFIWHRLNHLMRDDESLEGKGWLDDGTIERLVARANGLFIWARTACDAISKSVDPEAMIKSMLSGDPVQDANTQLGLLYKTVLDEALGEKIADAPAIKCCIAAIIISRIPLVDSDLTMLLKGRVELDVLRRVIRLLASVLYRDQNGAVRVLHQSFGDYMMSEQCPTNYRIDKDAENLAFAASCLTTLDQELRFNICELEDSGLYNHEIPDLATRIQTKIPRHLEYSCLYWASHLTATPIQTFDITSESLGRLLLGVQALYWIEVLSLLGRLHTGETSLLDLIDWLQVGVRFICIEGLFCSFKAGCTP